MHVHEESTLLLEAEQAAARLVKVEASTETDDSDPPKCCSDSADDGKDAN